MGESSSAFVPLLPSEMGTQGKTFTGRGFSNLRGKIILQPQAPPQRVFTFFVFLLCTGTAPGSRILFSGEEAGPASVQGTGAAFTVPLLAHHLKTPQCCSQFERAEKTLLCSGIFCGTTTEINSCNDTLQWDEDKFILLFPHSHNFYTSPHKSAQAASTLLVLSKEEKQHQALEGIPALTPPASL